MVTDHLLARLLATVTAYNCNSQYELVRKVKNSNFHVNYFSPYGASDTYLPLLNYINQKDTTLHAWKRNFIIGTLEFTSIETQQNILCILQSNYSHILQ